MVFFVEELDVVETTELVGFSDVMPCSVEELVKILGVVETVCKGSSELVVDISTEAGEVDVDNAEKRSGTSEMF